MTRRDAPQLSTGCAAAHTRMFSVTIRQIKLLIQLYLVKFAGVFSHSILTFTSCKHCARLAIQGYTAFLARIPRALFGESSDWKFNSSLSTIQSVACCFALLRGAGAKEAQLPHRIRASAASRSGVLQALKIGSFAT